MPQTTGPDRHAALLARNRRSILSTAQRLFAERGFAGTSVVRIAREAGVAATTVFNHFPHKEELFCHGRCPWQEVAEHLTAHPDDYTTGAELIEVVGGLVAAHLDRLAEPGARRSLVDLTTDPGLTLWERGLQGRAEVAISAHITRHAPGSLSAEAERCAALTIAEVRTVVDAHRRRILDPQTWSTPPSSRTAVLTGRLVALHDLVVEQVTGPLASR